MKIRTTLFAALFVACAAIGSGSVFGEPFRLQCGEFILKDIVVDPERGTVEVHGHPSDMSGSSEFASLSNVRISDDEIYGESLNDMWSHHIQIDRRQGTATIRWDYVGRPNRSMNPDRAHGTTSVECKKIPDHRF